MYICQETEDEKEERERIERFAWFHATLPPKLYDPDAYRNTGHGASLYPGDHPSGNI